MHRPPFHLGPRLQRTLFTLTITLALGSCGGGGGADNGVAAATGCSTGELNGWLASYMDEWYFWRGASPTPAPSGDVSLASYFAALLYRGGTPFPADRWSYTETTASFTRLFGDGQSLGYGISVAGLEVTGQPAQPLYVRYVEALSPAAAAGVRRGDRVLAINGVASATVIASNDFSALTASAEGQTLLLSLQGTDGVQRSVSLSSRVFALTPLAQDAVLTSAGGRKLGYVVVKDMISQVATPLDAAFGRLRAAGVQSVVLDLRYNGGGLVSVAGAIGSYLGGPRAEGRVFASLLYNERRAASNNTSYRFSNPATALDSARVYVLAGPRTCSASELVVNGLRGAGLDVVVIGGTSCGKPVGFLPTSQCGTTFNVVNFEAVNDRGEGRYVDGIAATCPVAEDFTQALGSSSEPLLSAALQHADTGRCPAPAAGQSQAQALAAGAAADRLKLRVQDGGERPGMLDR